jgi:hypothetical protein
MENGQWVQMAVNSGQVYSGGGSSNRVTARAPCDSHYAQYWRSYIFVSTGGGITYGTGTTYTSEQEIPCTA